MNISTHSSIKDVTGANVFGGRSQRTREMFRAVLSAMAVASLVFAVGCSDGDGDDDGGGNGGGGGATLVATLTINAPVYWNDSHWDGDTFKEVYTPFNGSRTVTAGYWNYDCDNYGCDEDFVSIGGSGGITNGQFNFTIGAPSSLQYVTECFGDMEYEGYDNFNTSNPGARAIMLDVDNVFRIPNGSLARYRYIDTRNTATERAGFYEFVTYIYVDRDVTVSGKGKTTTESWSDGSETYTTKDFSLNLKTGWNALYWKADRSVTRSGNHETYNRTTTLSLSNPSNIRWIIDERFDWDMPPTLPPASHAPLADGQWRDGNFTSRTAHWYSFPVTAGTTYYLWDNDRYGDGSKTADIQVDGWYADGTRAFYPFDDYYDHPYQFTASQSGTVYVRAYPEYGIGTYSIRYSATGGEVSAAPMPSAPLYKKAARGGGLKKKAGWLGTFRGAKKGFAK